MKKPTVSDFFNVEDIRKVREYNSLRHARMNAEDIVDDTKKGAMELLSEMKRRKDKEYTYEKNQCNNPDL